MPLLRRFFSFPKESSAELRVKNTAAWWASWFILKLRKNQRKNETVRRRTKRFQRVCCLFSPLRVTVHLFAGIFQVSVTTLLLGRISFIPTGSKLSLFPLCFYSITHKLPSGNGITNSTKVSLHTKIVIRLAHPISFVATYVASATAWCELNRDAWLHCS